MNDKQEELFSLLNWVIIHSEVIPTEAIEVLDAQKEFIKNGIMGEIQHDNNP